MSRFAGPPRYENAAGPRIDVAAIRNPVYAVAESNYASSFYDKLAKMIKEFDEELDDKHEVGVRLVSFGQAVVFHLTGMGYANPSLITFFGQMDGGEPVTLIQHVSQISILLMKLPLRDPSQPKHSIGFDLPPDPAEPTEGKP